MSLVFETIQTEGLAEISYLIGDDDEGIAAVFDPRADVDVYLELARAKNVAITHIFETHIHADLVSGARELQGRVESAKIFVNSAGRPDLLGEKETGKLAAQQFYTLRDFYMKLPDSVIIYPAHGSGSPCGAEIGDRLNSTIGYERPLNPFLQFKDVESFTRFAISTAPPIPKYYPRMKKVN